MGIYCMGIDLYGHMWAFVWAHMGVCFSACALMVPSHTYRPWFVNITAPRPREVVIVSTLPSLKTDQDSIKAAIQSVLTSLNPQDKVSAI